MKREYSHSISRKFLEYDRKLLQTMLGTIFRMTASVWYWDSHCWTKVDNWKCNLMRNIHYTKHNFVSKIHMKIFVRMRIAVVLVWSTWYCNLCNVQKLLFTTIPNKNVIAKAKENLWQMLFAVGANSNCENIFNL